MKTLLTKKTRQKRPSYGFFNLLLITFLPPSFNPFPSFFTPQRSLAFCFPSPSLLNMQSRPKRGRRKDGKKSFILSSLPTGLPRKMQGTKEAGEEEEGRYRLRLSWGRGETPSASLLIPHPMPCRPYPVSPPDGRAEGREEKSLSCLQVPLWVGGGRAARCSHSRGGAPRRRGRPCRHFEEGREGYSNPLPRRTKSDKKTLPTSPLCKGYFATFLLS